MCEDPLCAQGLEWNSKNKIVLTRYEVKRYEKGREELFDSLSEEDQMR